MDPSTRLKIPLFAGRIFPTRKSLRLLRGRNPVPAARRSRLRLTGLVAGPRARSLGAGSTCPPVVLRSVRSPGGPQDHRPALAGSAGIVPPAAPLSPETTPFPQMALPIQSRPDEPLKQSKYPSTTITLCCFELAARWKLNSTWDFANPAGSRYLGSAPSSERPV